jgi:hypothetical protein
MSVRVWSLVLLLTTAIACGSGSKGSGGAGSLESDTAAQREFWSRDVNRNRLEAYVRANTLFTLLHEVGHYFFHVLDVPIAGREEDAADRLAALLMMPTDAGRGPEAELTSSADASDLIWVAYSWVNMGRGRLAQERNRLPWYDEHSVDEQRGYDVLCMAYGHNPERYELAIQDREIGILDVKARERFKQRCIRDAEKNRQALRRLVGAYVASPEEIARKREAYLARFDQQPQSTSGSQAAAILRGRRSGGAPGRLLSGQPPGVLYDEYTSPELWWSVPWFTWDSSAFVRNHRMLEATRDELFALTLPPDATMPTVEARSCGGMVNAFYGIDPAMFEKRPDLLRAAERGMINPTITICYPLVDAFSWAGRTLIWRSEQEKGQARNF